MQTIIGNKKRYSLSNRRVRRALNEQVVWHVLTFLDNTKVYIVRAMDYTFKVEVSE